MPRSTYAGEKMDFLTSYKSSKDFDDALLRYQEATNAVFRKKDVRVLNEIKREDQAQDRHRDISFQQNSVRMHSFWSTNPAWSGQESSYQVSKV